eukprot:COSAG06_NODE_16170_length_1017_cov_0.767974_2_plen_61_part_00
MAVQAHVAYSKTIKGVCGFAAQLVYCAATHAASNDSGQQSSPHRKVAAELVIAPRIGIAF